MCRVAELLGERLREGGIRRNSQRRILQAGIVVLRCHAVSPSAADAVTPVDLIDPDARAATDCRYRRFVEAGPAETAPPAAPARPTPTPTATP